MADRREPPDEARGRGTTHVPPTSSPTTFPSGSPFVDPHPSDLGSTSLPPTRTQIPVSSSGETRALFASNRVNDPAAALGSSEQVRILFGKYLVVRKLGEGAMGEVWLVRHRDLGAERALKLINLGRFSDPEMRARARREARAMGLFSHPNAVAVHDANADGDLAYIEMEYLRGQSLNKVLEPGVPKPLDWVARMVEQLCAVLEVAHAHGIVHRDLKPSNMMLLDGQPEGREHLKILDFGIAKILHADEQGHDDLQTRNGATIGTPAYMSPEQIDSDSTKIDARSDIYAVGVILFEMLTGRRPFISASFKLTYDHLYTPPPTFSEANQANRIPEAVERLVLRCLEKDPNLRPQSARELGEEFRNLATPLKPPESATAPLPKKSGLILALLALTGLGLGTSAWLTLRPQPLTLQATPSGLTLAAGGKATITIRAAEGDRPRNVGIESIVTPPRITVTRVSGTSSTGETQFALRVDPNFAPGETVLGFRTTAGKSKLTAEVKLRIQTPKVETPPGFSPAPGTTLVQDNDRIYHSRIVRQLGDNVNVEFLFMKRKKDDEPASFYIMKDKVSDRVFAQFAAQAPQMVLRTSWENKSLDGPDLPAVMVTAREACKLADWLGRDGAKVRLPTVEQWDKAAGWYERGSRRGPFHEPWKAGDKTIAVGRDYPAPIGSSLYDRSPFECRDMAGNGYEWTRNSPIKGGMLPFPDTAVVKTVLTRGQSFTLTNPLMYEDFLNVDQFAALDQDSCHRDVGFRLVIDDL